MSDPSTTRPTRWVVTGIGSMTGSCSTASSLPWFTAAATSGSPWRAARTALSGADWAERGLTNELLGTALAGYDRMLGLDLEDLAVDGSITKSPGGGDVSGRSPVDRGKQGTRRSVVVDASGVPLFMVAAAANAHDSPLLEPALAAVPGMVGPLPDGAAVHLDAGYDSGKTRDLLEILGYTPHIATKGKPAPIQPTKRWPVERTHSWMNGFGKLRRFTDKTRAVIEFYLFLAAAITVLRRLIPTACHHYRMDTMPTTRRLR